MKVKTQNRTQASSRTSTGRSSTRRVRGPVKKNKKQDNTKIFIGIGVGAFFFFFIIIAAATSGGGSEDTNYSSKSTSTTKKSSYFLPTSERKIIYRAYSVIDDKLQDEFQNNLSNLPLEEARKQGSKLKTQKDRRLYNAKVDLIKKYKNKYPGLTKSYMNKIIGEGIDKNW